MSHMTPEGIPSTAFVSSSYGSRPFHPVNLVAANTLFRFIGFATDALVMIAFPLAAVVGYLSLIGHLGDFMDGQLGLTGVFIRVTAFFLFIAAGVLGATLYRFIALPTVGRSLGQKLMGVQCLSLSGGRPTWGMSLRRSILPFAWSAYLLTPTILILPTFIATTAFLFLPPDAPWIVRFFVLILALAVWTAPLVGLIVANYRGVRQRIDHRTLMDRMSDTRVVATVPEAEV